jgi:hypothetical protein
MNISSFTSVKKPTINKAFTKRVKKYVSKYGFVSVNIVAVIAVGVFLVLGKRAHIATSASIQEGSASVAVLDQVSSADIAANIALAVRLPEVDQVRNQADTRTTLTAVPVSDDVVVSRPQIVTAATSGSQNRKDILEYVVQEGDNVDVVASKFVASAESIKWSNGLSTNSLAVGTKIVVPPKTEVALSTKQSVQILCSH